MEYLLPGFRIVVATVRKDGRIFSYILPEVDVVTEVLAEEHVSSKVLVISPEPDVVVFSRRCQCTGSISKSNRL